MILFHISALPEDIYQALCDLPPTFHKRITVEMWDAAAELSVPQPDEERFPALLTIHTGLRAIGLYSRIEYSHQFLLKFGNQRETTK